MGKEPKLSVMNLTARYGGIDVLWANMLRQTEQDFELIICDALWKEREDEVKKYIDDDRLVYVRQNDTPPGAYSGLAHADNQGFASTRGKLIVSLQDYIWIPHNSLEKFWYAYQEKGDCLVGAVGHQYRTPGKKEIADPKGKITVFKKPFTGKPENQSWSDPRMRTDQGTFYETSPINWEMSYGSIPRKVIYELGGMDEEYDFHGFAYDNVNIAQRAEMLGYKTYLDQSHEYRAFDHDSWAMSRNKKKRSGDIAKFHIDRMKATATGEFPLKLNYLK